MKLTHSKLCEVAAKWLRKVKKQNCKYHTYPITGSEIACYNGVNWIETPDAIGFNSYSSCVIECKMSRSDFFADQKKPFRTDGNGMGQKRFYLCPENLIKESDLPQGWGLLYVDEKMKVKEVKNSDTFDLNVDGLKAERLALVSIAKGLKKHKGVRQMSELIKIVKFMQTQQNILVKILIHLGCRADLYDDFIRSCFAELESLEAPELKEDK